MTAPPPFTTVTTRGALEAACRQLDGAGRYFVDTEFRSAKGGHTLSLIQIAADDAPEVVIVDALAVRDCTPLAAALARPGAEWVVHAGRQDVDLLCEHLGLADPPALFDTQVAWALLGPESGVSLAYLLYRCFGERPAKAHQVDDWIRRPLSESQLAYAAADATCLQRLYGVIAPRLAEAGRAGWVAGASLEQCRPPAPPPKRLALDSFRNAWQLTGEQLAALQFLIGWHNDLDAAARDDAPGREAVFAIARALPATGRAMAQIRGVWGRWADRHGDALAGRMLEATRAAAAGAVPDPPPYATFERICLDGWWRAARAEVSAAAGVAPEIAFPKPVGVWVVNRLEALGTARRVELADEFDGWRADALAGPWRAYCG
jgi:ribonuclease D